MYKVCSTQRDDDKNSLSSSFWSDGDRREGEEDEEEKVVIGEGDFKPVGNAEELYNDASGEEVEIGEEDSKAVGVSEDSYREASEEVEEGVVREEDSKPVGDAEDSLQESSEEEEDSNPLSDSEDSYQEDSEEEEEGVETERAISEEDSKPVTDAEDSFHKASEEEDDSKPPGNSEDSHQEEEEEIRGVIREEDSKPVGDAGDSLQESSEEEEDSNPLSVSEDSYQEELEEEGVETERAISEEESKPSGDAEDSLQESSEEENGSKPGNAEDSHQEDEEEIEGVISEEESKPVGDAEDSHQEDEEEIEGVISEEESKPVGDAEDSHQEASEEEKSELNNQVNISGESLEGGNNDGDEEERCSSSSDSPAPSLMTSGYGTYKPEELEGGDYRDDHTITEFDQDSRGDLSEMRDDEEDDRSLCSFGWFDLKPTESDYIETEADVALCGDDDLQKEEEDITDTKPGEDKDPANEETFEVDLHAMSENEVTRATSEERQCCSTVVEDEVDVKNSEGGSDDDEGDKQCEMLEEDVRDGREEKDTEEKVELEDPDESSSNKDIKFIDSKVDFSRTMFDKMCEDWEGNLRQTKDAASCLEERLADLRLSSSAQRDFETEIDDVAGQSDTQSSDTDGVSFGAFESYIRGMTRTQSDGDLRPKPKSFIRPAMSQQTLKKTDPVAKYFEYKQHWAKHTVPGENERRSERREIKERLAYRPPPPKPRRVYVPNTYVVPTEKKRSALCWRIRNDLANGRLPHKFSHDF
ncbi:hypothetical protein VZT92_003162 [Zoarces viviparus]|uniref:Centriolar and ciliogenesis-associated protein HYLS1 C-terminal domain-containing protein n=1 Tax=Zoarces viviparus TaxID=48416 RepID=A0AAW1G263_ZOAVI